MRDHHDCLGNGNIQWAAKSGFFPYMLVTVGSGVSVMKVNSPTDFERVGGTALGGGSFWGLCKLLTNIGDFDELMEIIKGGDPTKTDLLVGDIYGGNYDAIGLNATTTASLFAPHSQTGIPHTALVTRLLSSHTQHHSFGKLQHTTEVDYRFAHDFDKHTQRIRPLCHLCARHTA